MSSVVASINAEYLALHEAFENHFWSTKMDLKGNSREALAESKKALDKFLANKDNLARVEAAIAELGLKHEHASDDVRSVLEIMKKTFETYGLKDDKLAEIKDEILDLEQSLAQDRSSMKLGFTHPETGEFEEMSSVQLRTRMRVDPDEKMRKACFQGLQSIGPIVAQKLGQVVKLRNALARAQGYNCFYDYNVSQAEGFSKADLFAKLDALEEPSRALNASARELLKTQHTASGLDSLLPWNSSFCMSGSIDQETSPYFPFCNAVTTWGKTFNALGIKYRGSTLNLDLLDRKGKYSNGFCHWPVPAYRTHDGKWVPSVANFTSLATPNALGSGKTAVRTLLHEAGHSAHFANVDPFVSTGSPFFSQERAPQSVAYAENQSMFLDKLIGDGDWLAKYAVSESGECIPKSLVEAQIRAVHRFAVFDIRRMLMVPYFEKALYELSDAELDDPERIMKLADEVEFKVNGGPSGLPLLSVPHILSGEASCYYHAYVLANMSVFQTREYFLNKYGYICDNPAVGKELTEHYWKPGASLSFLNIVKNLTGKDLSPQPWLDAVSMDTDKLVAYELTKYDRKEKQRGKEEEGSMDLDMRLRIVLGDEVIADSDVENGFLNTTEKFKQYVLSNFPSDVKL